MTDRQPLPVRSTISMALAVFIAVAAGWLTYVMGGTGALLAVIPAVVLSMMWSLRRRHRRDRYWLRISGRMDSFWFVSPE